MYPINLKRRRRWVRRMHGTSTFVPVILTRFIITRKQVRLEQAEHVLDISSVQRRDAWPQKHRFLNGRLIMIAGVESTHFSLVITWTDIGRWKLCSKLHDLDGHIPFDLDQDRQQLQEMFAHCFPSPKPCHTPTYYEVAMTSRTVSSHRLRSL